MSEREAERYAEYRREQEAYEQAQYDDDLSKAERRIAELEVYSEAVAELCDEETFQLIEAEFQLRKESRDE